MTKKVNTKQTGKKVAHLAGKSLENPNTPKKQRSIDASAVGQAPFKRAAKKVVRKGTSKSSKK